MLVQSQEPKQFVALSFGLTAERVGAFTALPRTGTELKRKGVSLSSKTPTAFFLWGSPLSRKAAAPCPFPGQAALSSDA